MSAPYIIDNKVTLWNIKDENIFLDKLTYLEEFFDFMYENIVFICEYLPKSEIYMDIPYYYYDSYEIDYLSKRFNPDETIYITDFSHEFYNNCDTIIYYNTPSVNNIKPDYTVNESNYSNILYFSNDNEVKKVNILKKKLKNLTI